MADDTESKIKKSKRKKNSDDPGKGDHAKKKKKSKISKDEESSILTNEHIVNNIDSGQPASVGRDYTVSIALPGSILDNAQSPELRTYLAGQIARAAVVFNIDEVVIFDESSKQHDKDMKFKGATKASDPNILLARVLQYLECPQYLRKLIFPMHPDLKYAGLLNPLDCPHHMRTDDDMPYREAIVLDRPVKNENEAYVNAGMRKEMKIDKGLKPGTRVTVKVNRSEPNLRYYTGQVVSPSCPRTADGLYWGYNVRFASCFGDVFTKSPYNKGYDITLGTSERGESIDDFCPQPFKHILIVFGGLYGLEASLESDETLNASDPSLLFDHYLNTCPSQGSRTIRTEEAILITMAALRPKITNCFTTVTI